MRLLKAVLGEPQVVLNLEMSVPLCCILLLVTIFIKAMVTFSTVPSLLGYRELFYPVNASCYKSYMMFKPSGHKNSTFTLFMYNKKLPVDDKRTITDCSLNSSGLGLCLLDQIALNLNQNDEYQFRLIEKTSGAAELKSSEIVTKFNFYNNRYERPKFLHAVTIKRETNEFVYLTWIELIPTRECYYEFNYRLRDYVYLRNNVENSIQKPKVNAKRLSNIPEFWRWSRCFTTIKQGSNKITDTYQVFYELNRRYQSNKTKLIDLQDLIPETRCYKINNKQSVMEWQSAVNNTNSVEILHIPFTHYKVSIKTQWNGTTQVFLPLNTSYFIINDNCSPSLSLFLDLCLGTSCTQQSVGCNACGNDSGRDPREGKNTKSNVEIKDFNYLWLVIPAILLVAIIGFVALMKWKNFHDEKGKPLEPRHCVDTPVKPRNLNSSPSEIKKSIQQRSLPPVPKPHIYDKFDIIVQNRVTVR